MLDADMDHGRIMPRCKRGLVEQVGACAGHGMMSDDGRKHAYCSGANVWSARDLSCLDMTAEQHAAATVLEAL